MSVRDCRLKLPLPELWTRLGWPGEAPILGKREQKVSPPWREERTPSMSVKLEGDFYIWFDHGQGTGGDEVKAIMLMRGCSKEEAIAMYHELAGVGSASAPGQGKKGETWNVVATYDYLDSEGRLLHQTVRLEPKSFRQRRPSLAGAHQGKKKARVDRETGRWWLWTLDGIEPVLYHLPDLIKNQQFPDVEVWIVEGEKDADALAAHTLTTTAPMGAKKWRPSYTETLKGRRIVLCGDSDAAGIGHLVAVGQCLAAAGCEIEVMSWPAVVPQDRLSEKWDAARWLTCELSPQKTPAERFAAMKGALIPWSVWNREPGEPVTSEVVISADQRPVLNAPKDGEDPRDFAIELGQILGKSGRYFLRGEKVMTLHDSGRKLMPLEATEFVLGMLDHVLLMTWVKAAKSERGGAKEVPTKLNKEMANQVLCSPQFRRQLPEVDRVLPVPVPVWADDQKSIVKLKVGYNLQRKVLVAGDVNFPVIAYADACRILTDEWLASWPYAKDDAARSMATVVAGMLAPFCDLLTAPMCPRPAFIFTANKEGSGKTVMATMCLAPTYGDISATMVPEEITDVELEKRLLAIALSGKPYMLLDNWKGHLQSAALEGFLTKMQVEGRLLGENVMAEVHKCTLVFVTANTVKVSPDMRRRSLFVDLFVEEVQPETRQFARWIDDMEIAEGREVLLGCLWSIVQNWAEAGCPRSQVKHGTFRQWGDIIGGICEHIGLPSPLSPPKLREPADRDLGPFQRMLVKAMTGVLEDVSEFRSGELMEFARGLGEWDFLDEDKPSDGTKELRTERKIFGDMIGRFIGNKFPNGYSIHRTGHVGRSNRRVVVHRPVPQQSNAA
jgi:hypothetical protein